MLTRWLLMLGITFLLLSLLAAVFNTFKWELFNLPGDFKFQYRGIHIYIPLMTGLIASILFSLVGMVFSQFSQFFK